MVAEIVLLQNVFIYLNENRYPENCSKNDKRYIQKKARKLVVKEGVLYYNKKDGNEVTLILSWSMKQKGYLSCMTPYTLLHVFYGWLFCVCTAFSDRQKGASQNPRFLPP